MDTSLQKSIDETSRKKIINNVFSNYFVEAGAGSGKTTVLVDRMVNMIKNNIKINHICAITFTKAAANEFYARFQKKLVKEINENTNDKEVELCKEALNNIDLAFMGTIDSFCNMILSEHPNEGKIPANSQVIDEIKADELYEKEYINIMDGLYGDELKEKGELYGKYDNFAKDSFQSILKVLLSNRDSELEKENYVLVDYDEEYKEEINTIKKIVEIINEHEELLNCKNPKLNDEFAISFDSYKNVFDNSWNDNIPRILKAYKKTLGSEDLRICCDEKAKAILGPYKDYFVVHSGTKKYYEIDYGKIGFVINRIQEDKYNVGLDFVSSAKDLILEKLKTEGNLTFNDYLVYLRDALKEDAKNGGLLIKHIYSRHKYFLIDEFQDTDPIQAEIFFYLAAKEIKENWYDCVPNAGSLFIVGDPKQSIYRFKGADVASYLKIESIFERKEVGEVLRLYCNFRSTNNLKGWFNETFINILKESNEQAAFSPMPVDLIKDFGFTGAYKYDLSCTAKGEDKDEYKIKDIISYLVDNKEISYKIGNETKLRKIKYEDFMVITPNKDSLARYTKVLREYRIPYFVEGKVDFKESKALDNLTKLYGTIINPSDNRQLYATLISPIFKIKEKDLVETRQDGFYISLNSKDLDNINNIKLREAIKKIIFYKEKASLMSPSSLFSYLLESSDVFNALGNKNMEYIYFVLELLKEKEMNKEIVTHQDAYNYLSKILNEKNDEERCPGLSKIRNQVHIANVHKVKGLEAPIVILASTRKKSKRPSFRIERNDKKNIGYLFNVSKKFNAVYQTIIETNRYIDTIEQKEKESEEFEHLRLEYVAATRAKNALIISNLSTKDGTSSMCHWCDLINDSLKDIYEEENIPCAEKKENNSVSSIKRIEDNIIEKNKESLLISDFEFVNPSKLDAFAYDDLEKTLKQDKNDYETYGDSIATLTGTLVHRLMEIIVLTKDKINKTDLVDYIIKENINDIAVSDIEYYKGLLETVYLKMHNGGYVQTNGVKQNILEDLLTAEEVFSEVPFTFNDDNKIYQGIIDLIYKKDNKYHIIDWKTNKDGTNLNEHYKRQLESYIKAVKKTNNIDCDATIYHIDIHNKG